MSTRKTIGDLRDLVMKINIDTNSQIGFSPGNYFLDKNIAGYALCRRNEQGHDEVIMYRYPCAEMFYILHAFLKGANVEKK